ncbi:MAG: glycoside hydrolase family 15 protein [Chloroflexota bacterium]|nr:glycoside hydrolase family 15 protein [Chloroflexota bacterium]
MHNDAYRPIADYGLIGDCHTAALVSGDGSVDWLCAPCFDSPSIFGRLLDAERGGHFAVRPLGRFASEAAYVGHSGVLRTTFRTAGGGASLTDFMPLRPGDGPRPFAQIQARQRLVRLVEGHEGEVALGLDFRPRPQYGAAAPALSGGGVRADAGHGDTLRLHTSIPLAIEDAAAQGTAVVRAGERVAFVLDLASTETTGAIALAEAEDDLEQTLAFWADWAAGCAYRGPYEQAVMRSAVTLKLLTYAPTGAMVAAPTTSLPEAIGGVRNWDYRYTWIRDASFAAYALFLAGHVEDGERFMAWVCDTALRCEAGQLRIMYGLGGERELPERTLDHLAGYRGSRPVRVGNAASGQFQLDVYGELLDCFHTCRRFGQFAPEAVRALWPAFARQVDAVADRWRAPDSGIWEVRSAPRHFVYSKVMAWVALDRGIKAAEEDGLPADLRRWRAEREVVRAAVLERGYDPALGAFARSYGEKGLDAANLLLPLVHFIGARDPRMRATIEATERGLMADGLVYRYVAAEDGLPGGEATFGVCTFWLVDNLTALGRVEEARALFERTLARATPLGLYAEELDPLTGAHLGNFPQALTHIGLINAAVNLARAGAGGTTRDAGGAERDVTGAAG